jgi:hypothetical protein
MFTSFCLSSAAAFSYWQQATARVTTRKHVAAQSQSFFGSSLGLDSQASSLSTMPAPTAACTPTFTLSCLSKQAKQVERQQRLLRRTGKCCLLLFLLLLLQLLPSPDVCTPLYHCCCCDEGNLHSGGFRPLKLHPKAAAAVA